MKLAVIEPMTYISPSSFMAWINCPYQTYLSRLAGFLRIPNRSSKAAAIGTIFDALVKDVISKEREINQPHLDLNRAINGIVLIDGVDLQECVDVATDVAKQYIKLRLHNRLLNAKYLTLQQTLFKNIGGVPILGKLDACLDEIVFDWKLKGFNHIKGRATPTSGYKRRVHFTLGEQPLTHSDSTLWTSNRPWAIQMIFYNWLKFNRPAKYIIHEIVNTSGGIVFVEHVSSINTKHSDEVHNEVTRMWETINEIEIEIPEPAPTRFKCESYGVVCPQALKCTKYMETLGDSVARDLV